VTDLSSSVLKMSMVTVLAWVAVSKLGGINALTLRLQIVGDAVAKTGAQTANPLKFFPDFHSE